MAALVAVFSLQEVFAERPVVVINRHANRCIGIHHLFGGDHFQLVAIGIETVLAGDATDFTVELGNILQCPIRTFGNQAGFLLGHISRFLNSSRNTG